MLQRLQSSYRYYMYSIFVFQIGHLFKTRYQEFNYPSLILANKCISLHHGPLLVEILTEKNFLNQYADLMIIFGQTVYFEELLLL